MKQKRSIRRYFLFTLANLDRNIEDIQSFCPKMEILGSLFSVVNFPF